MELTSSKKRGRSHDDLQPIHGWSMANVSPMANFQPNSSFNNSPDIRMVNRAMKGFGFHEGAAMDMEHLRNSY